MTKKQEKTILIVGGLAVVGVIIYLATRKTTPVTPTGTVTVSNAKPESATQYLENTGVNVAESYGDSFLQNIL